VTSKAELFESFFWQWNFDGVRKGKIFIPLFEQTHVQFRKGEICQRESAERPSQYAQLYAQTLLCT